MKPLTLASLATLLGIASLSGCGNDLEVSATQLELAGDPERGRKAIERYGCASCHNIPFIRGNDALVGPPLDRMGRRSYVAGVLTNSPENLVRWIRNPPAVDPLTAMPNLDVTEDDAQDIASFLNQLQ